MSVTEIAHFDLIQPFAPLALGRRADECSYEVSPGRRWWLPESAFHPRGTPEGCSRGEPQDLTEKRLPPSGWMSSGRSTSINGSF